MPIFIFEMKFLITVSDTQSFLRLLGDNTAFFFLDGDLLVAHRGRMSREMTHGCGQSLKSTSGVQGLAAVCC